jgi:hypothetical protein|eukprot:TRINITY_DN75758_c0_g1_i1.p1 TRINITY_DN75758_c0_g1~~TRINITY_DN75758_c0_g1_i1.p1  ORF type:complete len:349 (+),score=55.32 TRINITY_DN75758_c0_g1_i1:74-1048(+)
MQKWTSNSLALTLLMMPACAFTDVDQARAVAALPTLSFAEFDYPVANYLTRANVARMQEHLVPDDIIIASYPKSGTNWVKQIVHLIRLRADEERIRQYADKDLSQLIGWPECVADFNFTEFGELRPRAFFSHMPWKDVPKGARYIYITRDPEDIVPSYFKFVGSFDGFFANHTVNDVAQLMMDGLLFYGAWESSVASYWEQRTNPNVFILKFEDLKRDHAGSVARIAKFLKFDLTPQELARVVHMSTLSYMKEASEKISGSDWAEKATGSKVSKEYTLVDTGESGKNVLEGDAMKRHFRQKASPLLGNPVSYAEFKVGINHEEL